MDRREREGKKHTTFRYGVLCIHLAVFISLSCCLLLSVVWSVVVLCSHLVDQHPPHMHPVVHTQQTIQRKFIKRFPFKEERKKEERKKERRTRERRE